MEESFCLIELNLIGVGIVDEHEIGILDSFSLLDGQEISRTEDEDRGGGEGTLFIEFESPITGIYPPVDDVLR